MKFLNASLVVLWLVLQVSAGSAQKDEKEDAAESRATSFRAVEGPNQEDVPGGPLLVYAYGFILVVVVAYVARLGSLQSKNRLELERLTAVLERGRKA